MLQPQGKNLPGELEQLPILQTEVPVYPAHRTVLAVCVVVAELGPAYLVPMRDHGNSLRECEGREKIPLDPLAHSDHVRSIGWTLGPPVAAQIMAAAVAVILEVRLVVFFVIAHQIMQCESVVTGDEVHAGLRGSVGGLIQIAAAGQPRS